MILIAIFAWNNKYSPNLIFMSIKKAFKSIFFFTNPLHLSFLNNLTFNKCQSLLFKYCRWVKKALLKIFRGVIFARALRALAKILIEARVFSHLLRRHKVRDGARARSRTSKRKDCVTFDFWLIVNTSV